MADVGVLVSAVVGEHREVGRAVAGMRGGLKKDDLCFRTRPTFTYYKRRKLDNRQQRHACGIVVAQLLAIAFSRYRVERVVVGSNLDSISSLNFRHLRNVIHIGDLAPSIRSRPEFDSRHAYFFWREGGETGGGSKRS